jgi:hypothetical protein
MIVSALYFIGATSFGIAIALIVRQARDTAARNAYAMHVERREAFKRKLTGQSLRDVV